MCSRSYSKWENNYSGSVSPQLLQQLRVFNNNKWMFALNIVDTSLNVLSISHGFNFCIFFASVFTSCWCAQNIVCIHIRTNLSRDRYLLSFMFLFNLHSTLNYDVSWYWILTIIFQGFWCILCFTYWMMFALFSICWKCNIIVSSESLIWNRTRWDNLFTALKCEIGML